MEDSKILARLKSDQLAMSKQLSTVCLARLLKMAANMTSKELSDGESRIWGLVLGDYSPELLEHGFAEHFRRSPYFPKPAEILVNIAQEVKQRREFAEAEAARQEQETI